MPRMITMPDGSMKEDQRVDSTDSQVWWIMGIVGICVTGGFMAWMTTISNMSLSNATRLASVESIVAGVDHRLTRIEDKLDKVVHQ